MGKMSEMMLTDVARKMEGEEARARAVAEKAKRFKDSVCSTTAWIVAKDDRASSMQEAIKQL
jgi:hypothetical protein